MMLTKGDGYSPRPKLYLFFRLLCFSYFFCGVCVSRFNIEATKLTKKGFFSSDPNSFFIIHRAGTNGVFSPIYQSPVIKSKSNPLWPEFSMKEIQLCNGDPDRQLKIEVKKFKDNGRR